MYVRKSQFSSKPANPEKILLPQTQRVIINACSKNDSFWIKNNHISQQLNAESICNRVLCLKSVFVPQLLDLLKFNILSPCITDNMLGRSDKARNHNCSENRRARSVKFWGKVLKILV